MDYQQAMDYISSLGKFGSKPGLERIGTLLELMGNPQKTLRYIHIAGTSGKGSTAAMAASVLTCAGFRTGLYVSPFVEDFRERIQIDGEMIPREELTASVARVIPAASQAASRLGEDITVFELVTALAFEYFARQGCEYVVLEVGMGGRLDATNIIDKPDVAVITALSLDHTEYLGGSVEQIAFEKCGIIKPGCQVVSYLPQPDAAMRVIEDICEQRHAFLSRPKPERLNVLSLGTEGSLVEYNGLRLDIPLAGEHQINNAMTAVTAINALRDGGCDLDNADIERGIARTRLNGRFEMVAREPYCIVDGAHNAEKIAALCATMDSVLKGKKIYAVMGMSSDKDIDYCVGEIARRCSAVYAIKANTERAAGREAISAAARTVCPEVYECDEIRQAVGDAVKRAGPDGVVLGCGSLYAIGDIKKAMLDAAKK